MAVTILEVTNFGSKYKKVIVFQHDGDLRDFRELLQELAQASFLKHYQEGKNTCLDDIWADMQGEIQDKQVCRFQILDLEQLLAYPTEKALLEAKARFGKSKES